ncbi:MAG: hypothetical protein AAGC74_10590 [Verrucomicrobiota bacterium]
MENLHNIPGALEELQDSIYRERVLRARQMTLSEKADAIFELSELQLNMLHAGEMHRHQLKSQAEGWEKVSAALERLDKAREHTLYVDNKPLHS